ncbi:Bacterial regulatory proteins, tetR family [Nocardia otitidiscaviarum]|uniref:Bacterial regulatory proteins, tetR family n=1 Tax=Nocardia otitidiscaviarum TaxID=1823 RepID=A0A379JL40_9NOCA|nr:TetR/AcrR family transcriptional regulator [Nocardia otitidiscaviarum]SUD49327.1 Bacterial regulatory proteins, tetR family [Nocardia otitidiscaviarum]
MTRAEPATSNVSAATPESGFRRRLLDGMVESVRERGYKDTTVADVVRCARTSRRTFYEHFTGKEDCFIAVLEEWNQRTIARIYAAVDVAAPWRVQIRQAVRAWIDSTEEDLAISLVWIRESPALGEGAHRQHQIEAEAFITLIQNLTASPEFQAADLHPPTRQMATILYGGFRELIATTIEAGEPVTGVIDVAVDTALAVIGPRVHPPD